MPALSSKEGCASRTSIDVLFANLARRRVVDRTAVVPISAEFCFGMNSGARRAPTVQPEGACRSPRLCRRASARRWCFRRGASTWPTGRVASEWTTRESEPSPPPCPEERASGVRRTSSNTSKGVGSDVYPGRYDRVAERRRVVALARHYREVEGLSIAEIARHLGRSPATIKAYFYDPSNANKRPTDSPRANAWPDCPAPPGGAGF